MGSARQAHLVYFTEGVWSEIRHCRTDSLREAADIITAEAAVLNSAYSGRRYAVYSVWRPWKTVARDPLAICDYYSIDWERDLFRCAIKRPGISGAHLSDTLLLNWERAVEQRWYWITEQQPDEVLVPTILRQ